MQNDRLHQFSDVLCEIRDGDAAREISNDMRELVQAVEDTGKQGTLTVTFKVSRMKNTDALLMGCSHKLKKPEPQKDDSIFYALEDGSVSLHHPKQRSIFDQTKAGGNVTPMKDKASDQ